MPEPVPNAIAPPAAVERFWWQDLRLGTVAPHDYPPRRLAAARRRLVESGPTLAGRVAAIVRASPTRADVLRGVVRLVQDALVHAPVLQPAEAVPGFWAARRLGLLPAAWAARPRLEELLRQRLIMDPELLCALGEGRCGQCVALLVAALRHAGIVARPWQLPHHVVAEVEWEGGAVVVDADAFKHGVMFERAGRFVTRAELERDPRIVDRFKPTGWMFRRDSAYARQVDGAAWRGYVDFYSPEIDGQMSARYGGAPLLPPGVPRWRDGAGPRRGRYGTKIERGFEVAHAGRAAGYRVRVGRRSRGYRYDALHQPALANETGDVVAETAVTEPVARFVPSEPGRYFVTAAAVPAYAAEFPSYLWWSDELLVDVE